MTMTSEGRASRLSDTVGARGSQGARVAQRNKFVVVLFLCAIVALFTTVLSDSAHGLFEGEIRFAPLIDAPGLVDTLDNSVSVEFCDLPAGGSANNDYRVCNDGTVSYRQPNGLPYQKTSSGDRYLDIGVCGPTAVANVFCMQCGLCEKPISWLALTGLRVGGGTRDWDLLRALQSVKMSDIRQDSACPKNAGYNWKLDGSSWLQDYLLIRPTLKDLRYMTLEWKIQNRTASPSNDRSWNFNPVLVFLDDHTGKAGHVTTVVRVDLQAQTVVHNTWGRQYVTAWDDFRRLWYLGDFRVIYLLEPQT